MEFGINLFPVVDPNEKPAHQYYDEILRLAVLAEVLGFQHVKAVEHHFSRYGGYSPDPVVLLCAVAARTTRIRLVTGAVIPAFTHPAQLAARLALLDNLSQGRLDAGFGRGFLPEEFEAFGIPMEQSRDRFREGVDACRRLWSEEEVVWDGQFHQFGPVTVFPRPFQSPHPPVFVAVSSSAQSSEEAGRAGYHLLVVPAALDGPEQVRELLDAHRKAREAAGHPPGTEQVHLTYPCYLAEDRDEALGFARVQEQGYLKALGGAVQSLSRISSSQYPGYEHLAKKIGKLSFEDFLSTNKVLAGTPDDVRAQVKTIQDWFGADMTLSLIVSYGSVPYDVAARSLHLFAEQVAPSFGAGCA